MLYTITGARRETGQPITFNLEAPSADHASREANRNGIVVASVTLANTEPSNPDPTTPPPSPPQPIRIAHRPGNRFDPSHTALNHGIDDFFMFRSMLTPWLVRGIFFLATLATFVGMLAWPFYVMKKFPPREHFDMMLQGEVAATLFIVFSRILLELIIVIFRIHESLAELRLDLRTHR